MKIYLKLLAVAGCAVLLPACSTWTTANVTPTAGSSTQLVTPSAKKSPSQIKVTSDDIVGRKYKVIGDLDVTVNKTTIFNEDPSREAVDRQLREKAAELGADAVILARYGTVGTSFFSWGSLEGKGRAVVFTN